MVSRNYSAIELFLFKDERFLRLDHRTRLTWLFLLGNSSRVKLPGLVEASFETLSKFLDYPIRVSDEDDFKTSLKATKKSVWELIKMGWAEYDTNAELFYLPKAVTHNLPDNPNMLLGWLKKLREYPSSPLLRRWLSDTAKAIKKAFGSEDARYKLVNSACRSVSATGSLSVKDFEIKKGFYNGYPKRFEDGMSSALGRTIDAFNSDRNNKQKQESKQRKTPTLTLPLGDEKKKIDEPSERFNERQRQLWQLFVSEQFYVPGKGDLTVVEAVGDPVTLCEKLGGNGFKDVDLDLVYRLSAWSYNNKKKAKKNLGAHLAACFARDQKSAEEQVRIDKELANTSDRIKTFDARDIPNEDNEDQDARLAAMRRAGFNVDE